MLFLFIWCITEVTFQTQPDIHLEIHESPDQQSTLFMLAPHENEHVANDYLIEQVLEREAGRFVILRQHGERNIKLMLGITTLQVDPNRIFTPLGARGSLLDLNPTLKDHPAILLLAEQRVAALREFILGHIGDGGQDTVWIAVHNNTPGYDGDGARGIGTISMKRYQKRFEEGADYILDLNIGDHDEDNLFFITERADFERMKKDGWNVILQDPRVEILPEQDDGSLSILAEIRDYRYINIEAQRAADSVKPGDPADHGRDHLEIQKAMADYVFTLVLGDRKQ